MAGVPASLSAHHGHSGLSVLTRLAVQGKERVTSSRATTGSEAEEQSPEARGADENKAKESAASRHGRKRESRLQRELAEGTLYNGVHRAQGVREARALRKAVSPAC